jgi:recombination protein RecT
MDLPIDKNLGFAYIVPYKGQPTFQMGYKGYIQLAMRTGQYKTINACEVYEGEIKSINRFTGEIEFNEGRTSNTVVGYLAYFKLINGFEKYHYQTLEEIQRHAQKYSQGYGKSWSKWTTDFGPMALKTVLKQLLSKYGILSIDMQMGLQADQAHVRETEDGYEFDYPEQGGEMKNITPTQDLNARLNNADTADAWNEELKKIDQANGVS